MKEVIEVPVFSENVRKQGLPLSMVTKANSFIFVSGVGPMDLDSGEVVEGTITEQTEASLRVVQASLAAAGALLSDVVSARIYVTNSGHYEAVNKVWARYFPIDPPSRTFVTVGSWFNSFDIEVEVIAVSPA